MARDLRALRLEYGLTQKAVAAAAGIHQPDLSAIERGRPVSEALLSTIERALLSLLRPGDVLAHRRDDIRATLFAAGAREVRVFGSTARGEDLPGSDLDLLVVPPREMGLFGLLDLEESLQELLGIPVDLVPDDPRTAESLARAKAEAVPL